MTGLEVNIAVDRGGFALTLGLTAAPGTVTAIVGPNGAGKSTALRAIAGLTRPGQGRIVLNGRVLDDAASGHHVGPADRGIGVVFQDYVLFPHLSTVENVAFGLQARGVPRRTALARAAAFLDLSGLGSLAPRAPAALSGGEAQRVALARALILEPSLLLLDEPLSALDAGARLDVRSELAIRLRDYGGATVLVTHDFIDAIALADEVVVLENGSVAQRGTPLEVSRHPVNEFVARLVGLNLIRVGGGKLVIFSPAEVLLTTDRPTIAASDSVWRCRVDGVEAVGERVRVRLATQRTDDRFLADLSAAAFAALSVRPGDEVWASASLTEA